MIGTAVETEDMMGTTGVVMPLAQVQSKEGP